MNRSRLLKISNSLNQVGVALAVWLSRFNYLPANVSPLGTFGLFGNPVLFALSIVAFDALKGGFYRGFLFTYLGFAGYAAAGWLMRRFPQAKFALVPAASFWFFLASNFGSWYYWYPHNLEGLLLCYTLALPFYTRTLLGDLAFGYGYLLLKSFRTSRYFSAAMTQFSRV